MHDNPDKETSADEVLTEYKRTQKIPVGTRFSTPVHNGDGAHPAPCAMGTESFTGVKRPRRGVDRHTHLAPRLKKELIYNSTPPLGLDDLL